MPRLKPGTTVKRRSRRELAAHRQTLKAKQCACGHFAVSADDYYDTSGGRGGVCVRCYRESERDRQRRYRDASNPSVPALKSPGHAYDIDKTDRDPEVEAALGVLRDARAQRQGKQGYVYCIAHMEGIGATSGGFNYVKVGYSVNPQKRVAELQTGNPYTLRLLCLREGTEADEKALHAKYIKDNVLQEWFVASKALLLEFDRDESGVLFSEKAKDKVVSTG